MMPLVRLAEHFERLPGIGKKSAQRLAFHVLNMPKDRAEDFARCILEAREKIHRCARSVPIPNGMAASSAWWRILRMCWPLSAPKSTTANIMYCTG